MRLIDLSDEELMKRYQQDDYLAFDELYSRYKKRIYSYVQSKVFDKSMVDEVYQNVFLKLHKSRHLYSDQYLFKQWIFTLTKNIVIDYFRDNKITFLDESYIDSNTQEINADTNDKREIDLSVLAHKERLAIELRYEQDKDFIDIAEILKTNQTNVRKIISRATEKLKKKFSKEAL